MIGYRTPGTNNFDAGYYRDLHRLDAFRMG